MHKHIGSAQELCWHRTALLIFLATITAQSLIAQDAVGSWRGIPKGRDADPVSLRILRSANGKLVGFVRVNGHDQEIPVDAITLNGQKLAFSVIVVDCRYAGTFSADEKSIIGKWTENQGSETLTFTRTALEAQDEKEPISIPTPNVTTTSDPEFEVSTIKPSHPDSGAKGFYPNGREYLTRNTTLSDLLQVAYGVRERQITGMPTWARDRRFDVTASMDQEMRSLNQLQFQHAIQKLLMERFNLRVHHENRELPVYALVIDKGGTRLTKQNAGSEEPHRSFMKPAADGGTLLIEKNATIADLVSFLMVQCVQDRQVMDQTGLTGKFDFNLDFFGSGANSSSAAAADASTSQDAASDIFVGLREQLGLSLKPTKAAVDMLVIERADPPSEN